MYPFWVARMNWAGAGAGLAVSLGAITGRVVVGWMEVEGSTAFGRIGWLNAALVGSFFLRLPALLELLGWNTGAGDLLLLLVDRSCTIRLSLALVSAGEKDEEEEMLDAGGGDTVVGGGGDIRGPILNL